MFRGLGTDKERDPSVPRVVITQGAAQGLERCRQFLLEKNPRVAMRAGQAIERLEFRKSCLSYGLSLGDRACFALARIYAGLKSRLWVEAEVRL